MRWKLNVDYYLTGYGNAERAFEEAKKRDTAPDSLQLHTKPTTLYAQGQNYETTQWEVTSQRPAVRSDASKLYLKRMWDEATAHDVPLNPIKKEDNVPADLAGADKALSSGKEITGTDLEAVREGTHHSANGSGLITTI